MKIMGAAGFEPATTWSEAKHSVQTELSAPVSGFGRAVLKSRDSPTPPGSEMREGGDGHQDEAGPHSGVVGRPVGRHQIAVEDHGDRDDDQHDQRGSRSGGAAADLVDLVELRAARSQVLHPFTAVAPRSGGSIDDLPPGALVRAAPIPRTLVAHHPIVQAPAA
jgi:hypothetical protein